MKLADEAGLKQRTISPGLGDSGLASGGTRGILGFELVEGGDFEFVVDELAEWC